MHISYVEVMRAKADFEVLQRVLYGAPVEGLDLLVTYASQLSPVAYRELLLTASGAAGPVAAINGAGEATGLIAKIVPGIAEEAAQAAIALLLMRYGVKPGMALGVGSAGGAAAGASATKLIEMVTKKP